MSSIARVKVRRTKSIRIIGAIAASALLAASCSSGSSSGPSVSANFSPDASAGFTSINVASGFNLKISVGLDTSVKIDAKGISQDKINATVADNVLTLSVEPGSNAVNVELNATVTVPTLSSITASQGSSITIDNGPLKTDQLAIDLSNGSSYNGAIDSPLVTMKASEGAQYTSSGTATSLTLTAEEGATFDLANLKAAILAIDLSGGANVTASVSKTITGTLSQGATLKYTGDATSTAEVSGGAQVTKG